MEANLVVEKMRSEGMRVTPQKLFVINYLIGNKSHPTVEDIFSEAKKAHQNLSKKTIYSIVESLEKVGAVKVMEIGCGLYRVDPNTESHDHFICNECNKILDSDKHGKECAPLVDEKVHVDFIEILYRGTCQECSANKTKKERKAYAST